MLGTEFSKRLDEVIHVFDQLYSSHQLGAWYKLTRKFLKEESLFLIEQGVPYKHFEPLLKNAGSKGKRLKICALPFVSKFLFEKFLNNYFPEELRTPFRVMAWGTRLSHTELMDEYGVTVFKDSSSDAYYVHLMPVMEVFEYTKQWSHRVTLDDRNIRYVYTFYLVSPIAQLIRPFLEKPADGELKELDVLPSGHEAFSVQDTIFQELPQVIGAINAGMLKYGTNNKVLASSLKKIRQSFELEEFYPNQQKDKLLFPLRTKLLISLLECTSVTKFTEPLGFLKLLIAQFPKRYETIDVFLSHLKGSNKVEGYEGAISQEKELLDLAKNLPHNKWLSVDNWVQHLYYGEELPMPVDERVASYTLYYNEKHDYYTDKIHISNEDLYKKCISVPMLKGFCWLLGSFGLLDLSYNEIDTSYQGATFISGFDGLTHVRLNDLGAYVLGVTKSFEPPQAKDSAKITLSSDDLMILLDREDEVMSKLIQHYAQPVMPTRFKLVHETLLKGCASRKELKERIAAFCQTVAVPLAEMPDNWNQYFSSLLDKVVAIKTVPKVKVIQLPNNKDLLRVIAQDKKLKTIVTKAEGLQAIIKQDDWAAFKKVLKSYGYIIQ